MLMPRIFGENLLDDVFGYPFTGYQTQTRELMKADVKETADSYEIAMNLPGFRKEDIKAELKDGYLTVSATMEQSVNEEQEARYIRRERYCGSCSRSFYVGEDITQEEIKAKYTDGILYLRVPKKEAKPAVEEAKYIAIEG